MFVLCVLPDDIWFDPEKCKDKTGKIEQRKDFGADKLATKSFMLSATQAQMKSFSLWEKRSIGVKIPWE